MNKDLTKYQQELYNAATAEGKTGKEAEAMGGKIKAAGTTTNGFKTQIKDFTSSSFGSMLTVAGVVNTAGTGTTTLTTTGATTNNIVANANVGNASAATVLTSVGNITGTGTVTGTNVTLDSATGVGENATTRLNTAADSLAARTTASGGVPLNVGINASPALLSVGYIVGFNVACVIFMGAVLNRLIAVPLFAAYGDPATIIIDQQHHVTLAAALQGASAADTVVPLLTSSLPEPITPAPFALKEPAIAAEPVCPATGPESWRA
jgi:hypothetical protein